MNGWTQERRLKQQKAIHRWKPWTKSTGAKTAIGKAISSKNAIKAGDSREIRQLIKNLNKLLKEQSELSEKLP
jgi:hypothetical protein